MHSWVARLRCIDDCSHQKTANFNLLVPRCFASYFTHSKCIPRSENRASGIPRCVESYRPCAEARSYLRYWLFPTNFVDFSHSRDAPSIWQMARSSRGIIRLQKNAQTSKARQAPNSIAGFSNKLFRLPDEQAHSRNSFVVSWSVSTMEEKRTRSIL